LATLICLDAAHVIAASPDEAAGWGSIAGRVVFAGDLADPRVVALEKNAEVDRRITRAGDDSDPTAPRTEKLPRFSLLIDHKSRGVRNAFVYARKKPARVHPSFATRRSATHEVAYEGGLLLPHALIVQVGDTVRVVARDRAAVFALHSSIEPFTVMVSPDRPYSWTPRRREPGLVRAACEFWPTTTAWWLVVDHPYAALTTADGSFELKDLPAGELELTIWHEAVGQLAAKRVVKVPAGQAEELPPLEITPAKLKKS
jgi:hypothetical protein